MFCNICLERQSEYVEIPCGHDVCRRCALESTNNGKEEFRCSVCLERHPAIKLGNNERRSIRCEDGELERRLFCLDCNESFEFISLKNGRHRTHNVQSLQQSLPLLREIALSQLNKTLILQNNLLLSCQKENDEIYHQKIRNLSQQIHEYFQQERKLMLAKEEQLLKQIQELQQSVNQQLTIRREAYIQIYEQVHEINETLQGFINNHQTFDQLEALHIFKKPIQRDFIAQLKEIQRLTITIPKFIAFSTIQQYLNTNILLKLSPSSSQLSYYQQTPPISSKRVNLRSKVSKKLHCY